MAKKQRILGAILLSIIFITNGNANVVSQYDELSAEHTLTELSVAINKLKLENLKLKNEIATLSGQKSQNSSIKVVSISSFGNAYTASLSVDGKINQYSINDSVSDDLIVSAIDISGVSILDKTNNQTQIYLV